MLTFEGRCLSRFRKMGLLLFFQYCYAEKKLDFCKAGDNYISCSWTYIEWIAWLNLQRMGISLDGKDFLFRKYVMNIRWEEWLSIAWKEQGKGRNYCEEKKEEKVGHLFISNQVKVRRIVMKKKQDNLTRQASFACEISKFLWQGD